MRTAGSKFAAERTGRSFLDPYRLVVDHPDHARAVQHIAIAGPATGATPTIVLSPDPSWQPPDVVFLGDSITDRWNLDTHFAGLSVLNRGNGGNSTKQMVLRFHEDVLAYRPRNVVISGGINDIDGPSPTEVITNNLALLAELADRHGIRPVLAALMPVNDLHDPDMVRCTLPNAFWP